MDWDRLPLGPITAAVFTPADGTAPLFSSVFVTFVLGLSWQVIGYFLNQRMAHKERVLCRTRGAERQRAVDVLVEGAALWIQLFCQDRLGTMDDLSRQAQNTRDKHLESEKKKPFSRTCTTPSRAIAAVSFVQMALAGMSCSGPGGSKCCSRMRTLNRFFSRLSIRLSLIRPSARAFAPCTPTKYLLRPIYIQNS